MGRILAIDYGQKRVGLAVTDELQIIATGLDTVHSKDIFIYLKDYLKNEEVDCFVVGEPKQMNNKVSESAKFIEPFVKKLKKEFPDITIKRYDERFTSKIAIQSMITAGLKKKDRQKKETVDKISAVLILQSYLEFSKSDRFEQLYGAKMQSAKTEQADTKNIFGEFMQMGLPFITTEKRPTSFKTQEYGESLADLETLEKLSQKHGFNLSFEGGEAETFVFDCPLFSQPIKIEKSKKIWDGYRGRFEILEAKLDNNA